MLREDERQEERRDIGKKLTEMLLAREKPYLGAPRLNWPI